MSEETLQLTDSDTSDTETKQLPDDLSRELAALHQLRQSVKNNLRLRPIRSRSNLPKINLADDVQTPMSSYFTPVDPQQALPIAPRALYERLSAPRRPLLIDTRVPAAYRSVHLRHSVNIAIPSLILKRCRKPAGALQSLHSLRQFITTEQATLRWDSLMRPGGPWDGNVVVYDDELTPNDRDSTASAIVPVLQPLLNNGSISYLEGGLSKAAHHPDLRKLLITRDNDDDDENENDSEPFIKAPRRKTSLGLFQLDTHAALRSKQLPQIEPLPSLSYHYSTASSDSSSSTATTASLSVSDTTPSPPPSSVAFRKPPTTVPNLRRLDTKSAEKLRDVPKLSVRTKPMRSATLSVPPLILNPLAAPPHSPTRLNLKHSNHAPSPTRALFPTTTTTSTTTTTTPSDLLTPYYTPPHTPRLPRFDHLPEPPRTPLTARPDIIEPTPTTDDDSFPVFSISTILPHFLYLGPELTTQDHVNELRTLGVRRILNIAAECDDDDHGLKLREVFDKYYKIPMRDTVEEDNIARGVREVCDILDDARLHSAPTYVHCKAGKSRSVTAVMAYLIHANHWTLSQAYAFVLERRKGISPNIGFVSELMSFEEQELGGKSIGVQQQQPSSTNSGDNNNSNGTAAAAERSTTFNVPEPPSLMMPGPNHHHLHLRRGGHHVRESLPSMEVIVASGVGSGGDIGVGGGGGVGGPMSAVEGLQTRRALLVAGGDSGQEMEVKDASGRYRHARRAPVDENTLQPVRRMSKAGLESGF